MHPTAITPFIKHGRRSGDEGSQLGKLLLSIVWWDFYQLSLRPKKGWNVDERNLHTNTPLKPPPLTLILSSLKIHNLHGPHSLPPKISQNIARPNASISFHSNSLTKGQKLRRFSQVSPSLKKWQLLLRSLHTLLLLYIPSPTSLQTLVTTPFLRTAWPDQLGLIGRDYIQSLALGA